MLIKKGIQTGDILIFKGKGPLYQVLSRILKGLVAPNWDKWGWHMAIVGWYNEDQKDWRIVEATAGGVRTTFLHSYINTKVRVYRWLPAPPALTDAQTFYNERDAGAYDAIGYVWTILAELIRKYSRGRLALPRILNDRYYCWELVEEFCGRFGRPWPSTFAAGHRYPLITNFLSGKPKFLGIVNL